MICFAGLFSGIHNDGLKLLDENFVVEIFELLYNDLPELEDYLDYYLEENLKDIIGSH